MPQTFHVSLTQRQAYALAELSKRMGWEHARALAANEDEVRAIFAGLDVLRAALAEQGIDVR